MKFGKFLLILLLAFIPKVICGPTIDYSTLRYAEEYHQKRLELFKSEPVVTAKVTFLGDSIVEFGNWNELLNDSNVINRGIAGDNTFGVLARLEDVIASQPSKLFIEIGINDISQNIPLEIIVKNVLNIIKRVRAGSPKTEIYIVSVLPTNDNVKNEYPAAYNKNKIVDSVNKRLKRNAKKEKFIYIDLNKKLKDKNGKLDEQYAKPDGLHLNEGGYKTLLRLLKTKKYL